MNLVMPEFGLFFWMLVSFGIVVYILKRYAWKPILNALKERESSIEKALQSADRAKDEMAKLQADNIKIMNEAKAERDQMLKEAKETRNRIVSEAKEQAEQEARKVIESARQNIQSEKAAALTDIKAQVAMLSIEIAEKILRDKFAEGKQQQEYVNKLMDEIKLN